MTGFLPRYTITTFTFKGSQKSSNLSLQPQPQLINGNFEEQQTISTKRNIQKNQWYNATEFQPSGGRNASYNSNHLLQPPINPNQHTQALVRPNNFNWNPQNLYIQQSQQPRSVLLQQPISNDQADEDGMCDDDQGQIPPIDTNQRGSGNNPINSAFAINQQQIQPVQQIVVVPRSLIPHNIPIKIQKLLRSLGEKSEKSKKNPISVAAAEFLSLIRNNPRILYNFLPNLPSKRKPNEAVLYTFLFAKEQNAIKITGQELNSVLKSISKEIHGVIFPKINEILSNFRSKLSAGETKDKEKLIKELDDIKKAMQDSVEDIQALKNAVDHYCLFRDTHSTLGIESELFSKEERGNLSKLFNIGKNLYGVLNGSGHLANFDSYLSNPNNKEEEDIEFKNPYVEKIYNQQQSYIREVNQYVNDETLGAFVKIVNAIYTSVENMLSNEGKIFTGRYFVKIRNLIQGALTNVLTIIHSTQKDQLFECLLVNAQINAIDFENNNVWREKSDALAMIPGNIDILQKELDQECKDLYTILNAIYGAVTEDMLDNLHSNLHLNNNPNNTFSCLSYIAHQDFSYLHGKYVDPDINPFVVTSNSVSKFDSFLGILNDGFQSHNMIPLAQKELLEKQQELNDVLDEHRSVKEQIESSKNLKIDEDYSVAINTKILESQDRLQTLNLFRDFFKSQSAFVESLQTYINFKSSKTVPNSDKDFLILDFLNGFIDENNILNMRQLSNFSGIFQKVQNGFKTNTEMNEAIDTDTGLTPDEKTFFKDRLTHACNPSLSSFVDSITRFPAILRQLAVVTHGTGKKELIPQEDTFPFSPVNNTEEFIKMIDVVETAQNFFTPTFDINKEKDKLGQFAKDFRKHSKHQEYFDTRIAGLTKIVNIEDFMTMKNKEDAEKKKEDIILLRDSILSHLSQCITVLKDLLPNNSHVNQNSHLQSGNYNQILPLQQNVYQDNNQSQGLNKTITQNHFNSLTITSSALQSQNDNPFGSYFVEAIFQLNIFDKNYFPELIVPLLADLKKTKQNFVQCNINEELLNANIRDIQVFMEDFIAMLDNIVESIEKYENEFPALEEEEKDLKEASDDMTKEIQLLNDHVSIPYNSLDIVFNDILIRNVSRLHYLSSLTIGQKIKAGLKSHTLRMIDFCKELEGFIEGYITDEMGKIDLTKLSLQENVEKKGLIEGILNFFDSDLAFGEILSKLQGVNKSKAEKLQKKAKETYSSNDVDQMLDLSIKTLFFKKLISNDTAMKTLTENIGSDEFNDLVDNNQQKIEKIFGNDYKELINKKNYEEWNLLEVKKDQKSADQKNSKTDQTSKKTDGGVANYSKEFILGIALIGLVVGYFLLT